MQINYNNSDIDQKVYLRQNDDINKESFIPLILGEAAKAIFKPLKAASATSKSFAAKAIITPILRKAAKAISKPLKAASTISKPFAPKAIITPILHKAAKAISRPLKAALAKSNSLALKSNSPVEELKKVNLKLNESENITKDVEQVNDTKIENDVNRTRKCSKLALKNYLYALGLKVKDNTKLILPKLSAITAFAISILLYASTAIVPIVFVASFGAGVYGLISIAMLIFTSAAALSPYTLGALVASIAAVAGVIFLMVVTAVIIAGLSLGALALAISAVKIANIGMQYAQGVLFQK